MIQMPIRHWIIGMLLMLAIFLSYSCGGNGGGDGGGSNTQPPPTEGLSNEDLERIDAAPESSLPEDQVILPNGQSLSDYAKSRGITADKGSFNAQKSLEAPVTSPRADILPLAIGPDQKK